MYNYDIEGERYFIDLLIYISVADQIEKEIEIKLNKFDGDERSLDSFRRKVNFSNRKIK